MKTTRPWRKKMKMTPEDVKTSHAHGLAEYCESGYTSKAI
jgi:hypothetical protein